MSEIKKQTGNLPGRGPGRPKGKPNKVTILIKEAIVNALAQTGNPDKQNKGGATGYMKWLAVHEPKAFATLVGKVLPTQITGEDGKAITILVNGKDADLL